ncbi:uncharacterized protein IUM83_13360 [Phytophthora cinnamomi]|uniref:uncharacterized protein n=1 Tax=Phytophthora cinnamomi TaxID=4785 RepID=UPI0035595659|nr:hypothetical protein IUM83_13360 [Phytophthora cinnamomi]
MSSPTPSRNSLPSALALLMHPREMPVVGPAEYTGRTPPSRAVVEPKQPIHLLLFGPTAGARRTMQPSNVPVSTMLLVNPPKLLSILSVSPMLMPSQATPPNMSSTQSPVCSTERS